MWHMPAIYLTAETWWWLVHEVTIRKVVALRPKTATARSKKPLTTASLFSVHRFPRHERSTKATDQLVTLSKSL